MAAKEEGAIVAYYRVSTQRQGQSGLGLEAQRAAVLNHVARTGATLFAEYTEIETGTRKRHRPELEKALVAANLAGATLTIAKLDRLARNVSFLAQLMDSGVRFHSCDLPGANRMTLHLMSAIAEGETAAISERTRAALAAAKARGTRLGTPANLTELSRHRSLAVRQAKAAARYRLVGPLIAAYVARGWTIQAIADELTALKVPVPRAATDGRPQKPWSRIQVSRLVDRVRREGVAPVLVAPVPSAPTPRTPRPATRTSPLKILRRTPKTAEELVAAEAVKATKALAKAERAARTAAKRKAIMDAKAAYDALPEAERQAQEARLARLLGEQQWIFAKTMASNPHWYSLRKRWARDEDFVWAVEQIRCRGYRQKYEGHWYTQLDVGDHFYWTMGWPIGSLDWGWDRLNVAGTILINRKLLADAESARDSDSGQAVE